MFVDFGSDLVFDSIYEHRILGEAKCFVYFCCISADAGGFGVDAGYFIAFLVLPGLDLSFRLGFAFLSTFVIVAVIMFLGSILIHAFALMLILPGSLRLKHLVLGFGLGLTRTLLVLGVLTRREVQRKTMLGSRIVMKRMVLLLLLALNRYELALSVDEPPGVGQLYLLKSRFCVVRFLFDRRPFLVFRIEMTAIQHILARIKRAVIGVLDYFGFLFLTCLDFVAIVVGIDPIVVVGVCELGCVVGRGVLFDLGLARQLAGLIADCFEGLQILGRANLRLFFVFGCDGCQFIGSQVLRGRPLGTESLHSTASNNK